MNPSTAFATVVTDELVRCGLREAVLAPGSRSAALALALHARTGPGLPGAVVELVVQVDRSALAFGCPTGTIVRRR